MYRLHVTIIDCHTFDMVCMSDVILLKEKVRLWNAQIAPSVLSDGLSTRSIGPVEVVVNQFSNHSPYAELWGGRRPHRSCLGNTESTIEQDSARKQDLTVTPTRIQIAISQRCPVVMSRWYVWMGDGLEASSYPNRILQDDHDDQHGNVSKYTMLLWICRTHHKRLSLLPRNDPVTDDRKE